jgi:transposase
VIHLGEEVIAMPQPYSLDLRERVVRFVRSGRSRRAAAAHFEVSVSFVMKLMKANQGRGSRPQPQWRSTAIPSSNRIAYFCWLV